MASTFISSEQVNFFKENGYLVIENFLSPEEADGLKSECHKIVESFDMSEHRQVFDTSEDRGNTAKNGNDYFLASYNKVRFFFEKGALNAEGDLVVDRHHAINKIGHALHWLNPAFRRVTFDDRVKQVARALDFIEPAVCQSMYIFKNPRIGSEVPPHQDGTYLWTDPDVKLIGFWIALEDATEENGCLWFVPGSHKDGLVDGRRFVRIHDRSDSTVPLVYRGAPTVLPDSAYRPGCVKRGSLVLIDGYVVHKSLDNKSDRSREIYTWHVVETAGGRVWSKENWIQPEQGLPSFARLYTEQMVEETTAV